MTHDDVQHWLDHYLEAWTTNDPKAIGALFSDAAEYRYQPWADPVVGRDAIVASWLDNRDEPGTWTAHYDTWAVEGDRATAIGERRYTNSDGSFRTLYYSQFALRFDAHGACAEFIESFMELPEKLRAGR